MSFDYNPSNLPDPKEEPEQFMMKVREELDKIQQSARGASNYVQFKAMSQEPSRRYENMLVYADGDNWDPGDGPGLYIWDSEPLTSDPAAWNKVGKIPSLNFRPRLSADTNFYVNTTTGSDSLGDGTSGAPWKTINKGISVCQAYDLNGYTLTLNVADGTYSEFVYIKPFVGYGQFVLKGNLTTPSNVVVGNAAGNGLCVTAGAFVTVRGCRLVSGSGGISAWAEYGGMLMMDTCNFSSNGGVCVRGVWHGVVLLGSNITVSSGATLAWALADFQGSIILTANIVFSGTLSFGSVLFCNIGGAILIPGSITLSGGTISGLMYSIYGGGILVTSSVTIPGSGRVIQDGFLDNLLYLSGIASTNAVMKNVSVDLQAGYTQTSYSNGSKNAGWTPSYANGNFQDFTATGSHAVGVPSGHGTLVLDWTNSGAVTVSFSGYTKQNGDAITSTSGHKFRAFISTGAQGSLVSINALQ